MLEEIINGLEGAGANPHSAIASRNGEVFMDVSWGPFSAGRPHRMYSCAKSFVSLCCGILAGEGKLSLSDSPASFFPELSRDIPDEKKSLTVEDLLSMASDRTVTCYKAGGRGNDTTTWKEDYLASFFTEPSTRRGSGVFAYDSGASQCLACVVEKVSGMRIEDFMRERILAPLGADDGVRFLRDRKGNPKGASGLVLSPRDLLKVLGMTMRGGDGIVPSDYLAKATSKRMSTRLLGGIPSTRHGYGWQFWVSETGGWMMYGMGGQVGLCDPATNTCVVLTSDTIGSGTDEIVFQAAREIAKTNGTLFEKRPAAALPAGDPLPKPFSGAWKLTGSGPLESLSLDADEEGGTVEMGWKDGKAKVPFAFGKAAESQNPFPRMEGGILSSGSHEAGTVSVESRFAGEELGRVALSMRVRHDGSLSLIASQAGELPFGNLGGTYEGR